MTETVYYIVSNLMAPEQYSVALLGTRSLSANRLERNVADIVVRTDSQYGIVAVLILTDNEVLYSVVYGGLLCLTLTAVE